MDTHKKIAVSNINTTLCRLIIDSPAEQTLLILKRTLKSLLRDARTRSNADGLTITEAEKRLNTLFQVRVDSLGFLIEFPNTKALMIADSNLGHLSEHLFTVCEADSKFKGELESLLGITVHI